MAKQAWDGTLPVPADMRFTADDYNAMIGSCATIAIAPHNSLNTARANVVLTGVNDEDAIMTALGSGGVKAVILDGDVHLDAALLIPEQTVLQGSGPGVTELTSSVSCFVGTENVTDVTISDFSITGGVYIKIGGATNASKRIRCNNIFAHNNNSTYHTCFQVYSALTATASNENIIFNNCYVTDSDRFGFMLTGDPGALVLKNIRFIDCQAINCGKEATRYSDFVVGFDVCEAVAIENILLSGCVSKGSWESGFHMEINPSKKNIRFIGCLAEDNANDKPSPAFGAGFMVSGEVILSSCEAINNGAYGLRIRGAADGVNAVKAAVKTRENPIGTVIENTSNTRLELLSELDAKGLMVAGTCNNLDIDATLISSTSWAFSHYETGTNEISNSAFNLKIINPTYTGIERADIKYFNSCEFNIFYVATGSLYVTNALKFSHIKYSKINITGIHNSLYTPIFSLHDIIQNTVLNVNLKGGYGVINLGNASNQDVTIKNSHIGHSPYFLDIDALAAGALIIAPETIDLFGITTSTFNGTTTNLRYMSNQGTVTFAAGDTQKDTLHQLKGDTEFILVTPTSSLGNATEFFVSDVTSNAFRLELDVVPGQVVTFIWYGKMDL